VLITGETGTGKELVADLNHRNSRRSGKRFVSVNEQGAFLGAGMGREGKLHHASGGSLLLDEVGDMSLSSQAKVLRAIDTLVTSGSRQAYSRYNRKAIR
jgi:transcriptional regulator with GAF, ATPase, and Fis domain